MFSELKSMSVNDLWSLREELDSVLCFKLTEEMDQLDQRLRHLKGDSHSGGQARRPYPAVHPKFYNPARPSETWSGRGKQPRWLAAQLRSGKRLDDFRIKAS